MSKFDANTDKTSNTPMKTTILLFVIISLFTRCSSEKNIMPEGSITGYEYVYSGTMAHPIKYYKVERDADGVLGLHFSEYTPEVTVYRVPEETLAFIDSVVREAKLYKLSTSYRPTVEILDGYGWYLCISYEGGNISSGGENAYPPKNLDAGIDRINNHLQELLSTFTDADILTRYERN